MNLVCPYCLKTNDRHSRINRGGVTGPSRPKPGAFTMCVSCGGFSVMTDHLALRRATRDELFELEQDPICAAIIAARKALDT